MQTETKKIPLKYLFKATFSDGTIYEQTPEDVSMIDPAKRSCFFDVMEYEKKSPLIKFTLIGVGHEYTVNLKDGSFEIDGVKFFMHEGHNVIVRGVKTGSFIPLKDFRIIFFRQHTHSFKVGQNTQQELSHEIVYRMGWQATMQGQNYQQVMQFK